MSPTDPSEHWQQGIKAMDVYAPEGERSFIVSSPDDLALNSLAFIPGRTTMAEKVILFRNKAIDSIAKMARGHRG